MPRRNQTFEFTILIESIGNNQESYADTLYGFCDDGMLGRQDGYDFIDFRRKATSYKSALTSAIRDVRKAGMKPVKIKIDEYANTTDIARRLRRTRQNVRQLIRGDRGPGRFPPPAYVSGGNIASYAWQDIIQWFTEHGFDVHLTTKQQETIKTTFTINSLLILQRNLGTVTKVRDMWEKIPVTR